MSRKHFVALFSLILLAAPAFNAQQKKIVWSDAEQPIVKEIGTLRSLPDSDRANATKRLALQIRALPDSAHKIGLASSLANLATEGDFGRDTLQEVTTTLAEILRAHPEQPAGEYEELASLVRYEHMQGALDAPQYAAAIAKLEANDRKREAADFTLTDLTGKSWTLHELRGKVVLVNFWATWCPPCRKEMPDLDEIYHRFAKKGLVILAISDEDVAKVKPFIANSGAKYPILLDPGRKVNDAFVVEGIPKTFIYNRDGKLVAQSIDMRTRGQFLQMLEQAGMR